MIIASTSPLKRFKRLLVGSLITMSALAIAPAWLLSQTRPDAILKGLRIDASKPVDFHAAIFPDSVFIGQQATYQVAVVLEQYARGRLKRDPQFKPPALRGLLSYELGRPVSMPAGEHNGQQYIAHVFQRALFGISASATIVPPAQLSYEASRTSSYFSRSERYVVDAESLQIVVKPLPYEGRPDDFSGAVGVLEITSQLDSARVRVGDPAVLTVRVQGTGNIKLFPRPTVEVPWASLVAAGERVTIDSSGQLIRGSKDFDFILTPDQSGELELPAIRYNYFDPYKKQYAVAESAPITVSVAAGSLAADSDVGNIRHLPLHQWRGINSNPGYTFSPTYKYTLLALWIGATLLALVTWVFRYVRSRKYSVTVPPVGEHIERNTPAGPRGEARHIRRELLDSMASRLSVPAALLVRREDTERILRQRGVTRNSVHEILAVLDQLAFVGFGDTTASTASQHETDKARLSALATQVMDLVNREAVTTDKFPLRLGRSGSAILLLAGCFLLGAPRLALTQVPVGQLVQNAQTAYESRKYPASAELYLQAVTLRPNDVDLLDGWGTASWMAGDTVSAVIAWQRAARLEPMAGDLQERLALLPITARTGVAAVPMVPVRLLVAVATASWCAGMLMLMLLQVLGTKPGRTLMRTSTAAALLLAASGLGAVAWYGSTSLDPKALAVARQPEQMRAEPNAAAATVGGIATGDVMRVLSASGMWVKVEHADGRVAWVPSGGMVPLVQSLSTR